MGAFKNESLSLPEEEKEGEVGAIAHSAPSPFFPPPGNPFSRGGGVGGGAGITSQMMINRLFMFAAGGRSEGRLFLPLFLLGWPPFPPACRHATDTQGLSCEK